MPALLVPAVLREARPVAGAALRGEGELCEDAPQKKITIVSQEVITVSTVVCAWRIVCFGVTRFPIPWAESTLEVP